MATAYLGSRLQAGVIPRLVERGISEEFSNFVVNTGFVVNDTVAFVKIPSNPSQVPYNGPIISTVSLDISAGIDSSTGVVTAVGDSTVAARYITGSTIGRSSTGGVQGQNVGGSTGYAPFKGLYGTYTTVSYQEYIILMTITTAPTTAITGATIVLKVAYSIDGF